MWSERSFFFPDPSLLVRSRAPVLAAYMDAPKAIDEQIAELRARDGDVLGQIHELWTRRNTMSPLRRLPPEILGHVCHLVIKNPQWHHRYHLLFMSFHRLDRRRRFGLSWLWTGCLGICTHTRTIVIQYRVAWSTGFKYLEWALPCSSRAGSCPLSIWFQEADSYPVLKHSRRITLAHHLPQAREAVILFSHNEDYNGLSFIDSILNKPLPTLRALVYKRGSLYDPWPLSPSFLGGQVSFLTSLVLKRVSLSSNELRLPVLLHPRAARCGGSRDIG